MSDEQQDMQVFFNVFDAMQRQGPGSDSTIHRVLQQVKRIHLPQRIVDMGCGKGHATCLLARETQAEVLALDLHQPFIKSLQQRAAAEGLSQLAARVGSMDQPELLPGVFDLIWSEGSAYNIGFERALAIWRPLLSENGLVYISDMVQLTDELAAEARIYLEQEGVEFQHVDDRIRQAQALGYQVLEHFILPQQDWLDFYGDMEQQIKRLEPVVGKDHPVLISLKQEIDIYRRFGHQFGYACLLMQKTRD
ncbi:class I SAM-dependent methyltransferase [Marinospirillum alkaliphilum]|uniref:Methyltransferase domain-containing protein n=1 Tax=Marinospirillum alkaliphilum DSM 21637 TaxID=1122209 RepID=A0A1K1XHR5_9GAMM|nr:class I SAM-dependent methyltransferase [Marinospirillum alkaliphilum]SFX48628.1 Methyltransferase domain-containing protein [Marinospirillum alkaliphilum DSM 21637]